MGSILGRMLDRLVAKELGQPSSWVGRFVLGPLWNRRNSALNDLALERLALSPDDRVLEIGFGPGYLLGGMAKRVVRGGLAGIDVSRAMVSYSHRRHRSLVRQGRLDLRCGKAEALPFASTSFTKIVSVNSIFYWADPRAAFAEMARVLEEDGQIVLVFTDRASLEQKRFARQGLHLVDPAGVNAMLDAASFETSEVSKQADRHRSFWCIVGRRKSFAPSRPRGCSS
jgi:ubiquinone/menaquinone biosynthesis C-methylase UbiE